MANDISKDYKITLQLVVNRNVTCCPMCGKSIFICHTAYFTAYSYTSPGMGAFNFHTICIGLLPL